MPFPTPFYSRLFQRCKSHRWKDWAGYHAVCFYGECHEPEYYALRHAAGVIDVSPLYKYDLKGPAAQRLLSRMMVKDLSRMKVGQVTYCCWCDDQGYVLDDGTVARLDENHFRLTAAEPSLAWIERHSRGFDVVVEDVSQQLAALSVQGPLSREFLRASTDIDLDALGFFRVAHGTIGECSGWISRTGYTGDLGYELWVSSTEAERVYDNIMTKAEKFGVLPVGLDAMDMSRVEAGFIMAGVDYHSSARCIIDARKSTPFELGFDWMVQLDREPFTGQAALREWVKKGPRSVFTGLDIDWQELEDLFSEYDLPPEVPITAWRSPLPVYGGNGDQVGYASSGSWSPTLKKNLALAHLNPNAAKEGSELKIEVTAMYERHVITARVSKPPFFNPERKRK